MGCTQSKIENEEIVNRCKDRRQFMKDAVTARNAFAAAHSTYAVFLKNTGAALSDYAVGEVRHPHISSSSAGGGGASAALPSSAAQSHYEAPRPPPPLPNYPPSPLQRAASMPEISVHKSDLKRSDPIIEEENEEEIENESHSLKHRTSRSSGGGGGGGGSMSRVSDRNVEDEGLPAPPSPPRTDRAPPPPPPPESKGIGWDFFFAPWRTCRRRAWLKLMRIGRERRWKGR
ncbi:Nitrate regulatory gene2 protein [Camellia lanceoleosa]|uniref:Nitrate regulatory gene2 protein n=1 Tax=Camellia lanceoleosa TaxID=1840588 RepID=A0ACC0FC59_9ERIC|nr:Nitrate regulatory gene2 protein [Camellia lanceoleosa]